MAKNRNQTPNRNNAAAADTEFATETAAQNKNKGQNAQNANK